MHKSAGYQSAFPDYREKNAISHENCYLRVTGKIKGTPMQVTDSGLILALPPSLHHC